MFREIGDREEPLRIGVAADGIRAVLRHAMPEQACDVAIALLAGQLVLAGRTDHFRNLCVPAHAVESVLTTSQGIKQRMVVEGACHPEIFPVTGDTVEIRQNLAHTAEFGAKDPLLLLLTEAVHTK